MLKRFYYASAAVLMLAIAFHFGATAAHGQSSGTIAAVTDGGLGSFVVTTAGSVYLSLYGSITPTAPHWTFRGTIPALAPIADIVGAGYSSSGPDDVLHAFDANGGFSLSPDGGRTWARRGYVFGGPTPALQETWRQLKARFVPSRAGATPGATNR